MPNIGNEIIIDRRPDEVWAILGDLGAVTRWVPGVADARMEGMRRICRLEDGGEIHEEIADFSDLERRYHYEQTVHPLGLQRSVGALAVEPHANGSSRVVWSAELELADPMQQAQFLGMIEQGYAGALHRLKEVVEG